MNSNAEFTQATLALEWPEIFLQSESAGTKYITFTTFPAPAAWPLPVTESRLFSPQTLYCILEGVMIDILSYAYRFF